MTHRHSRHISPCGWPWKVNKRVSMPPSPPKPSQMHPPMCIMRYNQKNCHGNRTSVYATGTEMFVIHALLAYLVLSPSDQAFCISTYAFSFFSKSPFSPPRPTRSVLITLYTPENAKGLITQTQRTNIMFHSGSSNSVRKASHARGGRYLHILMASPHPHFSSCSVLMSEPESVGKVQNIKNDLFRCAQTPCCSPK